MSAHIYAYLTATRIEFFGEGCDDYNEEHGWIDRDRSRTELHDFQSDVRPIVEWPENDPTDGGVYEGLADAVRTAFEAFEGRPFDNGNGSFYDSGEYSPVDESWTYTYAVHFRRKFLGPNGWAEERWHPTRDGGVAL
ncbi:Hypothetical protein AJAP_28035 [Amycolatopsis japonica]|uniref:Uncharacterized protein n=1 Tax=Amycolatopsis japonica TaxID=208439 RepID=A0A075V1A2_9PSEU|nr:hypothetical protein [Amycolatopsis japonica]AIG78446.1 Hypothetical protein AJAP_28035 [Amycolatopsis japonica]